MAKKVCLILAMASIAVLLSGFVPKTEVSNITVQHQVVAGDTVWNICEKHFEKQNKYSNLDEFVYEVRKHNNLLGNKYLAVGRVISIPLVTEK